MKKILFVCTGNICRSPMAEGFFRELTKEQGGFEALSAGLGAIDGASPSVHSVTAMQELGIDITDQRSAQITPEMVAESDYIFGLSSGHVDNIIRFFPQARERVFLLREFVEALPADRKDIADPIGGDLAIYEVCRNQIKEGIETLIPFVKQTSMTKSSGKNTLAIGADHGGYALKETLRAHLEAQGITVQDYGPASGNSCDYPDFAQAVARSVASGQHARGVLICKSGVGMSMAANKVVGARAALIDEPGTAVLARQHNDANVLCLSANKTGAEAAKDILESFLGTEFEGGRHARRVGKLEPDHRVEVVDPDVDEVLRKEKQRQQENIELIASENFTSPAVMEAQGSTLTNKYAEGYPGKRWYGGCEHVDVVEELAIERAKKVFGAEYVNVQPHSGSGANMAVYFAVLKPGDKMLTMDLSHGGHLTHGNAANFSGKFFEIVHYGVRKEDERIDYDQLAEMAMEHKPKMITVGASAYPRLIDFQRMGEIAKASGAMLLADIAHIAGLVAAGCHPSPVPHADFVTTTTHKTLRGPRGGLIMARAEYVNVQPHSGSGANMAVYFAVLKPGDKMLTMDLSHGGHLTHGNAANFSGKFFEIVHYGVRKEDERIDYDQLAEMAMEHKPQMITVGASAYPRLIDFQRMGEIAKASGAMLLADIAHIAGLVAAGCHPSPVPHADFVTTTTHKTLRGPRGGLIMARAEYAKTLNSNVFPGIQGGPLMHVIAAKAICLKEALAPEFKEYQQQIILNAKALADGMERNGYRLVSGGTDNHLLLVDVQSKGLTGKECQEALDTAGITVNKNTIPFETLSPFKASGVRLGTPAMTTRGMREEEMEAIADMIAEVLADVKNVDAARKVRQRVRELTTRFPLPY